jgi:predicted metal-dependent phosphoesterase TrpH
MVTLSIYALSEDMKGRIPLRGDLHMHTRRSDGREAPAIVASNYRAHGYDFTVISDHDKYYPSLEAAAVFKDISDLNIVPGEEVHLPLNDVHYVNFGGTYSINALVKPSCNDEKGDGIEYRSLNGEAPDPMTKDEFCRVIRERAKNVDRENESERLSFAVMQWIYEHVQNAGGLGIFPHPYWLCQMFQLPEDYTEFVYREKPFDAFEVLGGENYYQHNGFQAIRYYEDKAKGINYPIVGSTDSHSSLIEHNPGALIASTFVFAKENERAALISAIKDCYTVALDTISAEYRMVGDLRLVKYARFLMDDFTPLHDDLCYEEGRLMKAYVTGEDGAAEALNFIHGRMKKLYEKYFAV